MKLRPLRFIGNKHHFIDKFLELEHQVVSASCSDSWTYIEPFVGSGSIFLNKANNYNLCVINDKDRNLMRIWHSLKEFDSDKFEEALQQVTDQFGDIRNCKQCWYDFRNWFNKTYWKKDSFIEGIYLMLLVNTTTNSIFRFGPNGFNSSYGNRYKMLNVEDFLKIKELLSNTTVVSGDYKTVLNDYPNTLYFCDPPYHSRNVQSYVENFDDVNKYVDFLDTLKQLKKSKVILTDIVNDINVKMLKNWNQIGVREIKNIGPSVSGAKTTGFEVAYSNF